MKTQELLRNKAARDKANKTINAKAAQKADQFAGQTVGNNPEAKEQMYGLAADVFEILVKDANGDPEKMQEMLTQYLLNPAAFAAKLTPEQQAKLRNISGSVPKSNLKN